MDFTVIPLFPLGTTELVLILVVVMILFGAGKLPEVAKALGAGIRNFKDGAAKKDTPPGEIDVTPNVEDAVELRATSDDSDA
jgi:sec-independent protein translocase protein TatA